MHSRLQSTPQKYPEDIQCIVDPSPNNTGGIYISNIEVAENPKTLQCTSLIIIAYKIGAVVTAIRGKNLSDVVPKNI